MNTNVTVLLYHQDTGHGLDRRNREEAGDIAPLEDFSDLLSRLLYERERSASWLARHVGVHPSTVCRWLDGTSYPNSIERVSVIMTALSIHDRKLQTRLYQSYRRYLLSRL